MKELMDKILRKGRKWTDIMPIAMALSFLLMMLGEIVAALLKRFTTGGQNTMTDPVTEISWMYFGFIGIWIVFLPALLWKTNRPMGRALLPNKRGNSLKGIFWGFLIGFASNAFCVLVSWLRKDIGLSFVGIEPLPLLLIFACVLVQSGAEELVCRWYLLNKLTRRYRNVWIAIIGNSLFFAALHLANPGINVWAIIQIAVIGIQLSIVTLYYDSFWGAVLIHTSWNYTQNIIFGLPNSGMVTPYSIFRLEGATNGPFFDVLFGVEGSLGAVILIAVLTVLLYILARKKGYQPADRWQASEAALKTDNIEKTA